MSTFSSLTHQRYRDGNEQVAHYQDPEDDSFKVRRLAEGSRELAPIDIESMRLALTHDNELLRLLERRLIDLQSVISMDFDGHETMVATLYVSKQKNCGRYLSDVSPCYSYVTLREHGNCPSQGFRAGNGMHATLAMPIYLTSNHAYSLREFLMYLISQIARVQAHHGTGSWHDLYVPDVLSHLMSRAIVDFSKNTVTEPAIQFVLDALRLLVFCCEMAAPGKENDPKPLPLTSLFFPNMKPLMKKFVKGFILDPNQRTRDKVPDLGDMFQWVSVLELLHDDQLTWDHLIHAVVVELVRRQARWFCDYLLKSHRLLRQTMSYENTGRFVWVNSNNPRWRYKKYLRKKILEPVPMTVLRYLRLLPKSKLATLWWKQCQVGFRVVLYTHAFYNTLVKGHGVSGFKAKYDKVLGAVYREDIAAIKSAQTEIMSCSNLSEAFALLGYPLIDDDIHRLLLWAISASNGYHTVEEKDPFESTDCHDQPEH